MEKFRRHGGRALAVLLCVALILGSAGMGIFSTIFSITARAAEEKKLSLQIGSVTMSEDGLSFSYPKASLRSKSATLTKVTLITVTTSGGSINMDNLTENDKPSFTNNKNTSLTWIFLDGQERSFVQAQDLIRKIKFNYQEGMRISVVVDCNDNQNLAAYIGGDNQLTYWPEEAGGNGHYYLYMSQTGNLAWNDAYTKAKNCLLAGRRGYLATLTLADEIARFSEITKVDKKEYNVWVGGTALVGATTYAPISDESTINPVKRTNWPQPPNRPPYNYHTEVRDFFYWACGPEAGDAIEDTLWARTTVDPSSTPASNYDYLVRQLNEPNNGYGKETCTAVLIRNDKASLNDVEMSGADAQSVVMKDAIFEFGGYEEKGKVDPGNRDETKCIKIWDDMKSDDPIAEEPSTPTQTGVTDEKGQTVFGLVMTKSNPGQASFEVPLYVTMAVVDGQKQAIVPQGYDIKNTAPAPENDDPNDPKASTYPLGVTSVSVTQLGEWKLVDTNPTGEKQMKLTIGNMPISATTQPGVSVPVPLAGYFVENGKPKAIPAGKTLAEVNNQTRTAGLGILAEVDSTVPRDPETTPGNAVAAFQVRYMVTAFDTEGNAIGNTYIGDKAAAAGYKTDDNGKRLT